MRGRITLLKSILTNFLCYYMSLFYLSSGVKNKIDKLQWKFLWGDNEEKKRVHYIKWKAVNNYRDCGRIGIIDLGVQNRALLNKWIWRYENERGSLWREMIAEKTNSDPSILMLNTRENRNFSSQWKKIINPLFITNKIFLQVTSNLGFITGNGENIQF